MPSNAIPLRAGIVGAGLMGYWHAKALTRAGARLVAVVDRDPDAAQRLAAGYRDAEGFSNVEHMLERTRLNVLHVCTPLPTHYQLAQLALDTGLNLLIEKPMTATAAETERLVQRAAARGVLLCPVHQFCFQDGVITARQCLSRIGRLVHMGGTFCSAGGVHRACRELDGVVSEILPHPLSLMQAFLPHGLAEHPWLTVRPGPGELRAVCDLSGITLSLFISLHGRPTACAFTIVGTEGAISLDLYHGCAVVQPGHVSRTRKISQPFDSAARRFSAATSNLARRIMQWEAAYPGLRSLVSAFYHAVRVGAEPPISREEIITIARVQEGLISGVCPVEQAQGHKGP